MHLDGFDQLYEYADGCNDPLTVAVAGATDPTVIEALRVACDRGWVKPILTGHASAICNVAAEMGVGLEDFSIIDANDASRAATELVRS